MTAEQIIAETGRAIKFDRGGKSGGPAKLSFRLGRLISELKPGREIRLGHGGFMSVYQDGRIEESYGIVMNDLPTPESV